VARPVATFLVGQGLTSRLTFPGTVQAADRAELAFRVSGPLVELPVVEGDLVEQGQLIARIDPRDYQIAVAQAKASFDQAVADAARFKRLYEREAVALAELEVRIALRDVSEAFYEQASARSESSTSRTSRTFAPGNRSSAFTTSIRSRS
jgi:multidrug efflux pump subunit AcrA (membrane-fusion protein)